MINDRVAAPTQDPGRRAAGSGPPVLRLRRAEEPPRVWSPLDAVFYNVMTTNVTVFFGVPLVAGAAFYYPVSSLTMAILIAGAFCLAEALVYAFLVSSMPRNGGDYVFQSRLLSGAVGSTFAFTGVVFGGALWVGISGWFASRVAVGPFLVLLGQGIHVGGLMTAGNWVMSMPGTVLMGLLATAWSATATIHSMVAYARVQRVLVIVGAVALAVLVAYLALTTVDVNDSTSRAIIYRSLELGFRHEGRVSGWEATLNLLPVVAFGLIYPGWVAFHAAEVRRVDSLRIQVATIVGAKVISVAFALVLLPLPIRHLGEELFGSSVYLALADPASFWKLAPRLVELPAAPWVSSVILFSLAVAINTWFWTWLPNHALAASRVILAMSCDRLLPRWMSRLHPRYGTPVNAVLVFSAVSSVAVLLYAFRGVWRLAIHGTLVSLIAFTVTCVGAALFPFVHRELYRESTAAPFEVLRVPVITIAGVAFVGFSGFLLTRYLAFGAGSLGLHRWETVLTIATMYGASLVLYVLFRRYRHHHEGADLEITYREAAIEQRPRQMGAGRRPAPIRDRRREGAGRGDQGHE